MASRTQNQAPHWPIMTDPRPTIGHVVHRLDLAGADQLAADVARTLADRYRFIFLSLGPTGVLGQQLIGLDHKVIQLRASAKPARLGPGPICAVRLRQAIARYRIDLLHAHQFAPCFAAGVARCRARRPPILYTDHGRPLDDRRRPARALACRSLLRDSDHITAAAEHVRDALQLFESIDPARITIIPTGIDPERFDHGSDDERAVARQLLKLGHTERVIIHVARFAPEKDHETALRAFARVHDQLPDARLVLVGDGPTRPAIEQLAWDLGVADHCLFLGQRHDVDALLPGADVCLLSSLAEGVAPTLLEAMAGRLPVVATSVGGNAEVVVHGSTGLLCPPRDTHTLAHNLTLLLRDPDLRQRMGTAARQRVEQRFTRRAMLNAYAQIYDKMLSS